MNQKLITIILTAMIVLSAILIVPNSITKNYNIPKLWVLVVGGFLLLLLMLCNYRSLTIDKKDIIILSVLGLVFLSTFLSSNIIVSIIGTENRYEGLLMFITYICIYMCSKKFFDASRIKTLLNIGFYVALIVGILGILQRNISCIKLYPIFNKGICSTFGNSNFFGSFISIVLPIAIACFIIYGNKRGLIISLLMFFNMIASGTRSAWVAFAVVAIFELAYLIKNRNKTYCKRGAVALLCFILIFIYLFNGYGIKKNYTTKLKMNQIINEIMQAKKTGDTNTVGSGRIEIWKMTLTLIAQKPILGCGTDNLKLGLLKYCREDVVKFALRVHGVPDKAHNEYLQIAATLGIPALIVYLAFISVILFPQMQKMFKNNTAFIFSITIISYLVQAFFNISTIGVAPIFWTILGLCDNKMMQNDENKKL